MVIEDDPIQRMYITRSLHMLGFTTQEAGTGGEAIRMLEELEVGERPAAVLADVHLPDKTLHDIMPQLNQCMPGRVIAMTSSEDVDDYERIMSIGCVDFIVKPARPGELKLKLASLMRRQRWCPEQQSGGSRISLQSYSSGEFIEHSESLTVSSGTLLADHGISQMSMSSAGSFRSPDTAGMQIPSASDVQHVHIAPTLPPMLMPGGRHGQRRVLHDSHRQVVEVGIRQSDEGDESEWNESMTE